jgi:patatin-like phospholipase/acyl hydrolase
LVLIFLYINSPEQVPALIIQELETKYCAGRPICETFDLVCGTSTGGIIALGTCVANNTAAVMADVYRSHAREVFQPKAGWVPWWGSMVGKLYGSDVTKVAGLYVSEGLVTILKARTAAGTGHLRLDAPLPGKPKVFVVSAKKTERYTDGDVLGTKPFLLKNYSNPGATEGSRDCYVWQAGQATGAAPSYFDSVKMNVDGREEIFVDGGIVANNPSTLAVKEARKLWPNRDIGCVVSIGCGIDADNVAGSPGVLRQARHHLEKLTSTVKSHQNMMEKFGLPDDAKLGGMTSRQGDHMNYMSDGALYLRLTPNLKHSPVTG